MRDIIKSIEDNLLVKCRAKQSHDRQVEGELGESRATMIMNFGEDGKTKRGRCKNESKLYEMITDVFKYYEEANKSLLDRVHELECSQGKVPDIHQE